LITYIEGVGRMTIALFVSRKRSILLLSLATIFVSVFNAVSKLEKVLIPAQFAGPTLRVLKK
jgi:uncharacterized membrane protein YiaA